MSEQPTAGPFSNANVPAGVAQPQDHRSPDTYTYQSENGPITVPKFKRLMTFGFVRQNRHLDEQDVMFKALEEGCTEQQLAAIDSLGINEVEPFLEQWRQDSGVGLGESSRS